MSKASWSKWGWSFWTSVLRHIGTAGAAWMGGNTLLGHSQTDNLKTLPGALLFGAVLPTLWTFLQKVPEPDEETTKETKL